MDIAIVSDFFFLWLFSSDFTTEEYKFLSNEVRRNVGQCFHVWFTSPYLESWNFYDY